MATGLTPYAPDRVLLILHTQFHTPSPQLLPQAQPNWTAETPHNIVELQHQTELLKQCLQHSSSSPTLQALNQLVKGCQLAMHSTVLLASQNKKLFAENQRQKRKRGKKRSYLKKGGVLTATEARTLVEVEKKAIKKPSDIVRPQALPKCSLCSLLEHNARTCPEC